MAVEVHAPRPGGPGTLTGMLTLDQLRQEIEAGTIDTVVTAFTDMQGRLMGKRFHARFFLDDTLEHGLEGCSYLLATDMDTEPQPGYEVASVLLDVPAGKVFAKISAMVHANAAVRVLS